MRASIVQMQAGKIPKCRQDTTYKDAASICLVPSIPSTLACHKTPKQVS